MKKAMAFLLAAVLALALCACSEYDDKYDDEDFLTEKSDAYQTLLWHTNTLDDGSCDLRAGSFSGVQTLYEFTIDQDQSACEVTSTLDRTGGEAKLLVVNTDDRTIAAAWPVGVGGPMTVTLPAGDYKLRIAGKSAKFEGTVTLMLDGQIQEWVCIPWDEQDDRDERSGGDVKDALQKMQDALDELKDGEVKDTLQDAKDTLQEAFEDPDAS